jgi:enterochelin esterase family protein
MTQPKFLEMESVAVLLSVLVAAPWSIAQPPQRQRTPNDALVSPEVSADHRVTFRIYAPQAHEVTVGGDWAGASGPVQLEKNDKGIWAVTIGPLTPDLYSYVFSVDTVRTLDPKNASIKPGIRSVDNLVFIPGKEAEFEEIKKVPHGEIRIVWYQSSTLNAPRRMHSGWSTIGRAGFILDNLIAEKKAKPMLVVMPNGSLPRPANLGSITPGSPLSPEAARAMAALPGRFTNELLSDVLPYVKKNFRVLEGAQNRALAGLSMGGGQTLAVVTSHPDQFAYVGVWSAGVGRNLADFEKRNAAFLEHAEVIGKNLKLFSISVGDKDFALKGSRDLAELLNRHGIKNDLHVSGGGHTWINWRHYLNDFAPLLFR